MMGGLGNLSSANPSSMPNNAEKITEGKPFAEAVDGFGFASGRVLLTGGV
jgi:hypothetical protein